MTYAPPPPLTHTNTLRDLDNFPRRILFDPPVTITHKRVNLN